MERKKAVYPTEEQLRYVMAHYAEQTYTELASHLSADRNHIIHWSNMLRKAGADLPKKRKESIYDRTGQKKLNIYEKVINAGVIEKQS